MKIKKYARQCSVTEEGMNEGWVAYDGEYYFKYAKDAVDWIKNEEKCQNGVLHEDEDPEDLEMYSKYSQDDWLEFGFNMDMCYWTSWQESE